MGQGSRIIIPGRQKEQAALALVEINKRLVREVGDLRRTNGMQAKSIQAMNKVFTDIATKLGTPVPKTAEEGIEALEKMMARLDALMENEKTVQMP